MMASGGNQPSTFSKLLTGARGYTPVPSEDAQVQNVKSADVYVFGDGDIAEDGGEVVEFEMKPTKRPGKGKRKRKKSTNSGTSNTAASEPLIFERPVNEGDTLQSIALKYGCQVSHLIRLNKLMTDQEFLARRSIKVPVIRHSLITEIIQKENEENGTQMRLVGSATGLAMKPGAVAMDMTYTEANPGFDDNQEDDEKQDLLVRNVSIRGAMSNQGHEAEQWLKKMDTDIHKILSSTNTSKNSLEEVTTTLTCKRFQPLQHNGADWGMRRSSVLLLLIIVVIAVPLLLILGGVLKKLM